MRGSSLQAIVIVLTGCAAQGPPATRAPALADPGPVIEAVDRDCRMVRALDGRAVCAAPDRRRAPARALPADATGMPAAAPHPDSCVVIGSFLARANAERWARYNSDFGTEVQRVRRGDDTHYRVLIGPLDLDSTPMMRAILSAVGVSASWTLPRCDTLPGGTVTAVADRL